MELLTACIVAALWQMVAHYLPWRGLVDRPPTEHKLAAHAISLVGIVLAFVVWDGLTNTANGSAALVAIALAAGSATTGSHLVDNWLALRNERKAQRTYRRVMGETDTSTEQQHADS